jgi:hypothetical protein
MFLVDETIVSAPTAVDLISVVNTTRVFCSNLNVRVATWRHAAPGNDVAKMYARVALAFNIFEDIVILCAVDVADLNAVFTGKNPILNRDGFGVRVVEDCGKNHKAS